MTKPFSPYRIATDGQSFRLERGHFPTDPKIEPVWQAVSIEMSSLTEAKLALDRANNPPVWRPVTNA